MSTTLDAIYEPGLLRLAGTLPFPSHSRVRVRVELLPAEGERQAWLDQSEATLKRVWDNDADDVYNELLTR